MKNQNTKNKMNLENVRKAVIVLIIIAIIVGIGYIIMHYINKSKRKYSVEEITQFKYYLLKQEDRYGVIDKSGKVIVNSEYDEIVIPNPEKPVFICIQNNIETGEYNTKILNEQGKELFTEYENVESISLKNLITTVPYEKSVLKCKKDGKYGLIDYTGKIVVKPIYDEIDNLLYKEGELLVKKDGKYGVINIKGTTLVEPEYDSISSDGFYSENEKYKKDGYIVSIKTDEGYRYGYIDYSGKELLKIEYNDIFRINNIEETNDIYLVTQKNGQSGLVKNDKLILNHQYQGIEFDERNKLLVLEKNKKYGIAKLNGMILLDIDYSSITIDGIYIYANKENQSYIYDLNGNKQNTIKYKDIIEVENNEYKITVDSEGKYGLIDNNGKIVVTNKYYYLENLYDNYFIALGDAGKVGIINNRDDVLIEIKYDVIQKFENTKLVEAYSNIDNKIEIYNDKMEQLVSLENAQAVEGENYIKVYSDKETMYLDLDGKERENIDVFPNNKLYAIKKDNKWGFSDKNGNVKIECIYDKVTDLNQYGFAGIMLNEKWGVINENGEIIIEPTYKLNENKEEPDFIGQYYKVISGYSDVYYTNAVNEENENE